MEISPKSCEVIGLIPAAGQGTRIGRLPCSKEIYPVGFEVGIGNQGVTPRVACQSLLKKMRTAGIKKVFIVLREGKWDIPTFLGDGKDLDMHIAYLMRDVPYGVPFTLDQAFPFIESHVVALGWPDVFFFDTDGYTRLLDHQKTTGADVVLGLFPAARPEKVDMVELDENGQLKQIVIKPSRTHLKYTWGMAVWTSVFSQFLHEFVCSFKEKAKTSPEIYVGDVIREGLEKGLNVKVIHLSDQPYLDIGTPDDLEKAVQTFGK